MTTPFRTRWVTALLPLLLLGACKNKQSGSNTAIIVEVTSDLAVPADINKIRLTSTDQQGNVLFGRTAAIGSGPGLISLPFRAGLFPAHETNTPIHVEVAGLLDNTPVVANSATLSFVMGKKVVLALPLLAVCKSAKCPDRYTCKPNGQCATDAEESAGLPPYTPYQPIPGQDAGASGGDGGNITDASRVDTRPDAISDRQTDTGSNGDNDAPANTGTASATGTGLATASTSDTGTGRGTGIGTGLNTDAATGTTFTGQSTAVGTGLPVTGTGLTTSTDSTVVATSTGSTKSTGSGSGTGTSTGSATVGTNTAVITSTGTASPATSSGTGTGTGTGAGTGTGTGTGTGRVAGLGCNVTGECQSGLTCLDGVCCTSATCPQCLNCGSGGTCSITVTSAEDTTGTTCSGASTCSATGVCKKKQGESCTAGGSECATGTCTDNRCCSQSCGTCQACTGAGGTCVAVANADDPDNCTGANTCNAAGVCKRKNGEGCTATGAGECVSGTCTDNHCCTQSCGVCEACTGTGGSCVAVTDAEDPDTCTGNNACNASGACKKKDGQPCTDNGECQLGNCNSKNLCGPPIPSCVGLPATCGPTGNGDCCASLLVPGGTFYRSYDGVDYTNSGYPATVSDFYLDKYEVTVGRFRKFVSAGKGTLVNPPAVGAGVSSKTPGSGWASAWNPNLAADTPALIAKLKCAPSYQTWTDSVDANENKPINCVDWYTAFAFCAWDGGRLATEAEWNYAASGGGEQRYYPWSNPPASTAIDGTYAAYCGGACSSTLKVGSVSPKGDGKWGQSDLAGNVWEWALDWYAVPAVNPCTDCATLAATTTRVIRGGDFGNAAPNLRVGFRNSYPPDTRISGLGVRCARSGN